VLRGKPSAKPKQTRAEAARRNGARGGRPREPRGPKGVSWTQVRRYARKGGERDDIVLALGLTPEQLHDPDTLHRLQQEMARGAALHRLDLLEQVDSLRKGGDGSVNATIASLREKLHWDRADSAKGRERKRPDNEGAVAELERVLRRVRAAR